ncbi:unnamed protein product [Symbiodinium pilosum]|uniref:Uncharacterized protein n=1 Tax=Symbiodinium pilosum TaxID=2952 RepID=A0A812X1V8_SYMPI|nr:unnamed protein product [Symbiodinium pilosum]
MLAVVLCMMEKVPPPSEATTAETSAPAHNLPPGYTDIAHVRPESRASLTEGRPWRVGFAFGSAPHSAHSLPSPGASAVSAPGTTPKSTPSLPAADAALIARSLDRGPQPREFLSESIRQGVQTSLPIFPPLASHQQQPQQPQQRQQLQPGPPKSGPFFRG